MSKHKSKNRQWLEKKCLPQLEGRTLFVGVEKYTKDYHKRVDGRFETIEINKKLAKYGSPHKHYTGDFLHHKALYKYDNVVLFGLFGQAHSATNEARRIHKIHKHAHQILRKKGSLISAHRCNKEISREYWQTYFRRPPFNLYRVIKECVKERQYIWWGEKQ